LLRRIEKGNNNPEPGGNGDDDGSDESKLAAMRARRQVVSGDGRAAGRTENSYLDLKVRVQNKLMSELDNQSLDVNKKAQVRAHIEELFNSILADESLVLSRAERQRLF